ncbi:MAG: ABC transporter permease [Armatimonadota bacterium]|nr:ABC transporter permease [Armatimonadota bacterium]MDR7427230.1 ABC transporter permease [Armatimonadota bacterium]MDR7464612.1 ABC transporter permease [Armatimonadota bacterium]MDR7469730.1 ABC transporter permease [Armatimonadota bacterium]MDR7473937.1 ABC transporter permease [Armatimonadota bacterium]
MSVLARELYIEAQEARAERLRTALLRTALGLGVGFILLPLLIVVVYSFSSVAYGVFPPPGLSLRWYGNLLAQDAFRAAFLRSLGIGIAATTAALVLGFLAALALVRARFTGRELLRAFILSPIVMPKIVLGVGWFIFFARLGLQGGVLPLILAHTVVVLPFVVTILAANMVGLDPSIEEAAQDLGAGLLTVLWRIVLPQIRPGLAVSALLAFIISFDQVESSIFLVRGTNNTLPIEMFLYMEKWQDPTIAALSTVLILFAGILVAGVVLLARGADLRRLLGR